MSRIEEGVGYCPFCRSPIELNDSECSNCGTAIKEMFLEWISNPGSNPGSEGKKKTARIPKKKRHSQRRKVKETESA